MGRGKHCSAEKREIIKKLISQGKTYAEVGRTVGCSNKMIRNALKFVPKPETRGRKRSMSPLLVRRLIRQSQKDPFKPATVLRKELNITACVETVRSRLRENGLKSCTPRKVPLLTSKHLKQRLKFAEDHLDWPVGKWRNILWTDESKIVLYGGKGGRDYVRRPQKTEFDPKFTTKTLKHGGTSIMVWACFSYNGVGPIYWIKEIMDQYVYVRILEEVMYPYAEEEMPLRWVFQQDNDPKHTSRRAKKWFGDHLINVMEWPAQSPDLNPIENLWTEVKKAVHDARPTSKEALWEAVKDSWSKIPKKKCQDLVDSMPRRCAAVIKNKGHATKY